MITKCCRTQEKRVFDYIGQDYPSCLYLYLNLKKYGSESETVDVYIQLDGEAICAVMLKYYSCLHVYSKNNSFCTEEFVSFFCSHSFTMLYCAKETAERVIPALPLKTLDKTVITKGWVAKINRIDQEPTGTVVKAEREDFDQIAGLLYEDEDIGRSYNINDLTEQLRIRNLQGYARNLVIRKGDLVIAHACTNAELGNIAVVAELIVRREYRRKGYASEIWRSICSELLSEGKEVYSFYYTEESRNLHKHMGFFEICEWEKIVIT